jgi:acetyl esterase
VVIEVGYRLAPEHPFPAAVEDVRDVVREIRDHVPESASGLVLDGISSGAGIAVGAAFELVTARDMALNGLVLEVPSVDLRPGAPWLSEYAGVGGLLPRETVRDFYLAGADPADPRASPAAGDLRLLPAMHVATAEFDPLREVGERFAAAAAAAGVPVTTVRHAATAHNSFELVGGSARSRLWHAGIEAAIRDLLSRSARTERAAASSTSAPTT